jgi:hypothetical protein
MDQSTSLPSTPQYRTGLGEGSVRDDSHASGVTWSAVIAGAFVSAALAVILLALGTGLGLSSVSPWTDSGASASTIGAAAVLWLIVMQIISSAMGGYLTGRLRTKWAVIHSDEIYFRDTAHGFLAWAVALVITAAFLTSAMATMVGGEAPSSATASSARGREGRSPDSVAYFVDTLFRSDHPSPNRNDDSDRMEAGRILTRGLRQPEVPVQDGTYLATLVSANTGLSPSDATQRVTDVLSAFRQAADSARKAAAHLLLWLFVALLIGAFCASFAATIGGRQRDHVKAVQSSL